MTKPAAHVLIDSDSHISTTPEIWARYLDPALLKHPEAPRYWEESGTRYLSIGRVTVPPRWPATVAPRPRSYQTPGPKSRPGATDPNYRVRDFLDPEGFDRSLLMPESAWWPAGIADVELGNAMSEAYNNYLHDFARQQPTRLFGIGVLNAADPRHAVKEMRRCVKQLGFPAIYLNNEVYGSRDDDYVVPAQEHYYPIYEEAEKLRVPIVLHAWIKFPIPGFQFNRKSPTPVTDIYGMVYAGMELLDNLITGGICETFPNARFGIFECGVGWVPTIVDRYHERMQKFGDMMRTHAPKMKLHAEEYIQRQIWFGFEPEDAFVPDFIRWTKAPNRLLFSADYPHLDFEPGQLAAFMARDDISAEHRRLTVREAPLEFYRWEDTTRPTVAEERGAAD
jgi:predicted TIM-barrel fold metal-dependent hydrolase